MDSIIAVFSKLILIRWSSFNYSCKKGFSGLNCELDFSVCNATSNTPPQCFNGGTCIDGLGLEYSCFCQAGFTGKKCENETNECDSNPCLNDGRCNDFTANYSCTCNPGKFDF